MPLVLLALGLAAAAGPGPAAPQGAPGQIRGAVTGVNVPEGWVLLETANTVGGGPRDAALIHGLPSQVRALAPGGVVTLRYLAFDGARWLPLDQEGVGGSGALGPAAVPPRLVRGRLDAVGRAAGIASIGGKTVRAHPEVLRAARAGDCVVARVVPVSGVPWAIGIRIEEA